MNLKWTNKPTEKSTFKGGETVPDSNHGNSGNSQEMETPYKYTHTNARTHSSFFAFTDVQNQQHVQLISMMEQRQSAGVTNNTRAVRTAVIKAHFTLPQSARPHARSHLSELDACQSNSPLNNRQRRLVSPKISVVFSDFCISESLEWERKTDAWLVWDDCKVIDRADGTQITQQISQDVTAACHQRAIKRSFSFMSLSPSEGKLFTFTGETSGANRRCRAERL